ncbi:CRE-GES-1 protein [Aphelenchoides avenae]|nr:CRE-GES-1 protein [Aphelenchus avenae]
MARREPNLLKYQPRIDGEFFDADLLALLQTAPQKPAMMGFTEKEAMYFTVLGWYKTSLNKLYVEPSKFKTFDRADFLNFLSTAVASKFGQHKAQALADLVDFYLSDEDTARVNRYYYLEKYDQVLSDTIFIVPILRQAKYQVAHDWPTYLYFNTYYNPAHGVTENETALSGCTHGNEYPYMNGLFPIAEFEFTDADRQHQSSWASAIGGFAKNGQPVAEGVDWSPVSKENPLRHLHIAKNLSVREDLMSDRLKLWSQLYAKYGSNTTMDEEEAVTQLAKN